MNQNNCNFTLDTTFSTRLDKDELYSTHGAIYQLTHAAIIFSETYISSRNTPDRIT